MNKTGGVPLDSRQVLPLGMYVKMLWYTCMVITPITITICVLGNVVCTMILSRNGLNKPSNIFLLALSVADICVAFHGYAEAGLVATRLRRALRRRPGIWEMPYGEALFCYHAYVLAMCIGWLGSRMSIAVATLITFERLIAVYFPLRFVTIVTARRAWSVTALVFLFWLAMSIVTYFSYTFTYVYVTKHGVWVGEFSNDQIAINALWDTVNSYLNHYVPLVIIATGCFLTVVKVKLALRRRKKLTNMGTQVSGSRTTTMLVIVCLMSCFPRVYVLIYSLLAASRDSPRWSNFYSMCQFLGQVMFYQVYSANFIIYFVFNKRFRKSFKNMFLFLMRPPKIARRCR